MTNPVLMAHGLYSPATVTRAVQTVGGAALNRSIYPCDTSANAFTMLLPASPQPGFEVTFVDYARSWGTKSLTIGRNGALIMGLAEDYEINSAGASRTFFYVDNTKGWLVR